MDACSECGFVYDEVPVDEIPARLTSLGPDYRDRLVSGDPPVARGGLRNRPDLDVWTPLEYACHLRDLLEVQRARLALALTEECPTFAPMGREELVVIRRYDEQDPVVVADQIDGRTEALALAFGALDAAQWRRTAIYNWPAPAERSMAWMARHTVHEGEHHLGDIDRLLGRTRN
jgi:DinB superfamily